MKTVWFFVIFFSMLLMGFASAQDHMGAYGYAFGSLGAFSDGPNLLTSFGGGGEKMFTRNIGFDGSLAYLAPTQALSAGYGVLDLNGSYHFVKDQWKVDPFVTGGYTLAFREGFGNLFNVGGGVNYWWSKRMGMRVEFRDHIYPGSYDNYHQLDFRAGIVFH